MTPKQSDISVLIATRNLMAQELLMQALNRQAHLHVVASATGAQEALEAAQSAHVDVALITATLADGPLSGFEDRKSVV